MSLKPKRVDFTSTWNDLQETVKGVITLGNVPRGTWNDRFSDVYSLCVAYPEPLADKLYAETKKFLENHVSQQLAKVKKAGEQNLLSSYHDSWKEFSRGIDYLHKLYLYLNTQHIKKQKLSDAELTYGSLSVEATEQMKEIGELGLHIWKTSMIEPLEKELVGLLLEGIKYDRMGGGKSQYQPDSTIYGVIQSLVSVEEYKKKGNLDLYEEIFEKRFLSATGEFYREEAAKLLGEGSISQYMEKVIQRIEAEDVRSRKFLYPSSYQKVTSECEQRMVGDHLAYLHSECKPMVAGERRADLANLYRLLKSITGAQQVLLEEVQNHIRQAGLEAVADMKGDTVHVDFVENMLAVHKKYRDLIQDVFQGDQAFVGALDKACTAVINHREPKVASKSPELLARYCDSLLKKSSKGISESEIDDKLAASITIFKYLDDKDVFQKFYSRSLGKRLIHIQSHSMDMEEAMINRLKQACGYEFTSKFHRMFTDILTADDLNSKFTTFLQNANTDVGLNYFIRVLQQGAWPLSHTGLSPIAVPLLLEKTVQMFEAFYSKQFSGRKLTWLHHLSNGDVRLGYTTKNYIVNMTTTQMAVLLLFDKSDSLSYKELQETTKLTDDQFPRYVQSLLEAKLLLISGDQLSPSSTISLNLKYTNKRTKFRIAGTVQKETPQEVEATHHAVEEDRKMYLQAAIVRIMKSRKVLKHNALIQEVLGQSKARFAPSISIIKKCIEMLIDKQYIERTANSTDEYSYVA
jgi:cullin 2